MKEKIAPCPFCGSKEVVICRTNESACWVRCADCGGEAPAKSTRTNAIAAWNNRPVKRGYATILHDEDKDF
jgi:Lar family restriction alleviation protein